MKQTKNIYFFIIIIFLHFSKDLKRWMDESTNGVVYFSLGAKVLLESFPEQKLKQIYSSFAKISPVRVLVKVVNITNLPDGLPKNFKCMPWIPQQPVLGKYFVSPALLSFIHVTQLL